MLSVLSVPHPSQKAQRQRDHETLLVNSPNYDWKPGSFRYLLSGKKVEEWRFFGVLTKETLASVSRDGRKIHALEYNVIIQAQIYVKINWTLLVLFIPINVQFTLLFSGPLFIYFRNPVGFFPRKDGSVLPSEFMSRL